MLGIYQECISPKDIWKALSKRGTYGILLLVTYVLPAVPQILRPHMRVSVWTLMISIVELVIAVRTFVDGRVLKPCQLVVYTIEHSASHLMRFGITVLMMSYVFVD